MATPNYEITRKAVAVMASANTRQFNSAMNYAHLSGRRLIKNGATKEELLEMWRMVEFHAFKVPHY